MKPAASFLIFVCCLFLTGLSCNTVLKDAGIPGEIQKEAKPWAYWWWMGNSVTTEGITANLEKYSKAGIGGLHIIPIYGEKGDESNFIEYLSPAWMDMLKHTLSEAERLDLGIDMTCGTGWPFGGPFIGEEHTAKVYEVIELKDSEPYDASGAEPMPSGLLNPVTLTPMN